MKASPKISSSLMGSQTYWPVLRESPRDYLSDTPLGCALWGFGVSTWPMGCDTPSPFSERFPPGEHAKWRCDTPPFPEKGYLSDTCAIPSENKDKACDTPLCDTISKGYCATWEVSRTGPLITRPQLGPFFCPEIRAFAGFGARFLQPFSKSLVALKYYSNTKIWPLMGDRLVQKKAPIGAT